MSLVVSILGVVLVAVGLALFARDAVLSLRERRAHNPQVSRAASHRRFLVAASVEVAGVALLIAGGTFTS